MPRDVMDDLQALTELLWAKADMGDCVTISRVGRDDGSRHVEVVAGLFDIVVTERGRELDRTSGLDLSQAARVFLFDMAQSRALASELRSRQGPKDAPLVHANPGDDGYSRWNWMAPTIDTLRRISDDLGDWALRDYQSVLQLYPLKDYELRNARYPLTSASQDRETAL